MWQLIHSLETVQRCLTGFGGHERSLILGILITGGCGKKEVLMARKYVCDRCKKEVDSLEYVSFTDSGYGFLTKRYNAELCKPCLNIFVDVFKRFMNGDFSRAV